MFFRCGVYFCRKSRYERDTFHLIVAVTLVLLCHKNRYNASIILFKGSR